MEIKYFFYALRPKQWIKNFFIFLPLIFGGKLFVYPANIKSIIAFLLFSIAASVAYLINDIIDVENDKLHPAKRLRPIASGKLGLKEAWIAVFVLGGISIALSFLLDMRFGVVIAIYLVFNLLYSKVLKNVAIVDVFCIGGFFLLRIIGGGIVAEVQLSHWIIFMTVLLALFLGLCKRRQDMVLGRESACVSGVATKYNIYFIDQMVSITTVLIIITYMFYTVDERVFEILGTKHLMYSIPFVCYGIFHYLHLIYRSNEEGDPTRILITDKKMQLTLILWIIVCVFVIYFGI